MVSYISIIDELVPKEEEKVGPDKMCPDGLMLIRTQHSGIIKTRI